MSRISKLASWLNSEIQKDKKDLDIDKKKFISEIKNIKKEDIFKKDKLTFWGRIKKVFF